MNCLYFGDNLPILRDHIAEDSVDLIYLDPPFNSQASYNVLFHPPTGDRSKAPPEAFEDTWHWDETAEIAFDAVMASGSKKAAEMLGAMRAFLKENDMMAYLAMMAVRLLELRRVLATTGSIYLHCDPTAVTISRSSWTAYLDQKTIGTKFHGVAPILKATGQSTLPTAAT